MLIAREYAELMNDRQLGEKVYKQIKDEYERSCHWIIKIAQIDHLLEDNPLLKNSLGRRDPYMDPLNHIQLALLRRYRDETLDEDERDLQLDPLLRSINAIAAGMRNTG